MGGFDSFLQDMAHVSSWHTMLNFEADLLDKALNDGQPGRVNPQKAEICARLICTKLDKLLKKTHAQFDEYKTLVEAVGVLEADTRSIPIAGRGLRPRKES